MNPQTWNPLANFVIEDEHAGDITAREALLDRAMGPGRKRKSSEALRRGRVPAEGLAFVARDGFGALVGTVRLWNIWMDGRAALLLGPLAVAPEWKGAGIGSALMDRSVEAARRLGHGAILLVGDPDYYARFGFSAGKTAELAMPGPYERDRFLALELVPGFMEDCAGVLKPAGRKAVQPSMRKVA